MTIEITTLVFILLIHFLADFGLQTHDQATKKSFSINYLNYHVGVYSLVWLLASFILFKRIDYALIFTLITYFSHFITDYLTSRIGKPFWENKDMHNGFVVVGADQIAHYLQLICTYTWITNLENFGFTV